MSKMAYVKVGKSRLVSPTIVTSLVRSRFTTTGYLFFLISC